MLAVGYDGMGDFMMTADGRVTRRAEREVAPFVYTGAQLVSPALFKDAPAGKWSVNRLWDQAIAAGRLAGLRHDGEWFEVGRPQAIGEAERLLYDLGFRKPAS